MTLKGSLRRGASAGMEKREHHYQTKKLPILYKTWEEALNVHERQCQSPIRNSAPGLVPPYLSHRWSKCCIFTPPWAKQKDKSSSGCKLPLGFAPARLHLMAMVLQLTWFSRCPSKYPSCSLWFQQLPMAYFFHQKFTFSLSSYSENPYLNANQRAMPHPNSRAFF